MGRRGLYLDVHTPEQGEITKAKSLSGRESKVRAPRRGGPTSARRASGRVFVAGLRHRGYSCRGGQRSRRKALARWEGGVLTSTSARPSGGEERPEKPTREGEGSGARTHWVGGLVCPSYRVAIGALHRVVAKRPERQSADGSSTLNERGTKRCHLVASGSQPPTTKRCHLVASGNQTPDDAL